MAQKSHTLLILSVCLFSACSGTSAPVTWEVIPAVIASDTPRPSPLSPTLTPAALISPPHPLLSDRPLDTVGPWLAFITSAGLWAANADGTGLFKYANSPAGILYNSFSGPAFAVAAQGGNIAYVSDRDNPSLELITLPSTQPRLLADLLAVNPCQGRGISPYCDLTYSVGDLAWSPDGKYLAFTGAMDGQSSDLYVYSTVDGRITRLTSGPSQAIDPLWSPDGRYIVSFGAITLNAGLGGSSGPTLDSVWAVRPDGSDLHQVDTGSQSAPRILGWLDNQRYLQYYSELGLGIHDLELINIYNTQKSRITDTFSQAAYNPSSGSLLVTISDCQNPTLCHSDRPPGDYLFSLRRSTDPQTIDLGITYWEEVLSSPENGLIFISTGAGVKAVDPQGKVTSLDYPDPFRPSQPCISPDGEQWMIRADNGFWIETLQGQPSKYNEPEVGAECLWAPDGSYFLTYVYRIDAQGNRLVTLERATAPDFNLTGLIGPFLNEDPLGIAWVQP